jgi:hypothetical protein
LDVSDFFVAGGAGFLAGFFSELGLGFGFDFDFCGVGDFVFSGFGFAFGFDGGGVDLEGLVAAFALVGFGRGLDGLAF